MKPEPLISKDLAGYASTKGAPVFNSEAQLVCTPAQLQQWLRDEHKIHVNPYKSTSYNSGYWIGKITRETVYTYPMAGGGHSTHTTDAVLLQGSRKRFTTYEEALEYGLLKGLDFVEESK